VRDVWLFAARKQRFFPDEFSPGALAESNSRTGTPSATAIFWMLTRLTFRSPRSMPPMVVRSRSAGLTRELPEKGPSLSAARATVEFPSVYSKTVEFGNDPRICQRVLSGASGFVRGECGKNWAPYSRIESPPLPPLGLTLRNHREVSRGLGSSRIHGDPLNLSTARNSNLR